MIGLIQENMVFPSYLTASICIILISMTFQYGLKVKFNTEERFCGKKHDQDKNAFHQHSYNPDIGYTKDLPWVLWIRQILKRIPESDWRNVITAGCGATLIRSSFDSHGNTSHETDFAITAAQCVFRLNYNQAVEDAGVEPVKLLVEVVAGMNDRSNMNVPQVQRVWADQIWIPRLYLESVGQHPNTDIAVIRFKSPLIYTENVQPICLPPENWDTSVLAMKPGRSNCSVGTFGNSPGALNKDTSKLQVMKHLNFEECPEFEAPESSLLCTNDAERNKAFCPGDRGSGLACPSDLHIQYLAAVHVRSVDIHRQNSYRCRDDSFLVSDDDFGIAAEIKGYVREIKRIICYHSKIPGHDSSFYCNGGLGDKRHYMIDATFYGNASVL